MSRAKIIHFPGTASKRDAVPGGTRVVSEFYVHAVLQAARARALGLSLDSAKSWGLNRAIFYEAAKKGYIGNFRRSAPKEGGGFAGGGGAKGSRKAALGELYTLGGERAYAVRSARGLLFAIGGKEQTPGMFDRQIKRRFPRWSAVWSEASRIMDEAPESTLKSAYRFHKDIYKPLRGELCRRWPEGEPRETGAAA